jgi:ABC-type nitrate/sulfonate/bicarbonate transport system substrate-binding protein
MENKRNFLIAGIVVIAILLVVAGYYAYTNRTTNEDGSLKSGKSANMEKIRLIFPSDSQETDLLYNFAKDKGFFDREGLEVQRINVEKDVSGAFIAGAADVMLAGASGPISSYLSGVDVRILASLHRIYIQFGISNFPKDQIQKVKKVGRHSNKGETPVITNEVLKNLGLDPKKIEFIAIPSNEAMEKMQSSGEFDFSVISNENFLYKIDAFKKYTVYEPQEIIKNTKLIRWLFARQKTINEKPEAVKRLVAAFYKAIEAMTNDKEGFVSYVLKFDIPKDRAEKLHEYLVSAREGLDFVPQKDLVDSLVSSVKATLDVEPAKDTSEFIYPNFAETAKNSLK